jgi:hypothetical protein
MYNAKLRELDISLVEKDTGRVIGRFEILSSAGYELNPVSCILYAKRIALHLREKLRQASLKPNITQHFE